MIWENCNVNFSCQKYTFRPGLKFQVAKNITKVQIWNICFTPFSIVTWGLLKYSLNFNNTPSCLHISELWKCLKHLYYHWPSYFSIWKNIIEERKMSTCYGMLHLNLRFWIILLILDFKYTKLSICGSDLDFRTQSRGLDDFNNKCSHLYYISTFHSFF